MGQKVHPYSFRLGYIKDWGSRWFAKKKDFGPLLIEDAKIRSYIKKNLMQAAIARIEIERAAKRIRLIIHSGRPGVIIGRKGAEIDRLRDELREVVKEREEIVEDEFDHIIKDALILDFDNEMRFNEFVDIASEELSQRVGVEKEKFIQLFIEREKQSCTALRPGLAIPHIIIDGEAKFDVLLVRAKKGIIFPDAPEPVHIVFVLVGTRDRRRSHLRALMAIAQIAQQHGFDEKWLNAPSTKDLRDIILLGERKRH